MKNLNAYFWIFALYAVLITPVALNVHIRFDGKIDWRMRLYIAGIPVVKREKKEKPGRTAGLLTRQKRHRLAFALVRDGSAARMIRSMHLQQVQLYARLSFEDAAATAMTFAFLRTLMQSLTCCGVLKDELSGALQADFGGKGTGADVRCIFTGRLGKLCVAGIHLMVSAAKAKAGLTAEEEEYAAAPH